MENAKYLRSILSKKNRDEWLLGLDEILRSDSLTGAPPHDESVSFLLLMFNQRMEKHILSGINTFGLPELIEKLALLPKTQILKVFPLKTDIFSGDCIVYKNSIIGCAFIKRDLSLSRKGLWINGKKID